MSKDIITINHGEMEPKFLGRTAVNGYEKRGNPEEEGGTLRRILGTVYRKKAVAAAIFLLIMVIGFVIRPSTSPVYESAATVEIENRKVAFNNLSDPLGYYWDFDRYVSNQIEILRSRGLARMVVVDNNVGDWPEFDSGSQSQPTRLAMIFMIWREWKRDILGRLGFPSPTPAKMAGKAEYKYGHAKIPEADRTENLAGQVQSLLKVERLNQSSSVLKVMMTATSAETAQKLLEKSLQAYLEKNSEKRKKETQELLSWLHSELKKSEEKQLAAEKELLDFVNKNGIVAIEGGGFSQVSDMLNKTVANLMASRQTRVKLEAHSNAGDEGMESHLPEGVTSAYVSRLKDELGALEARDTELNGVYSEEYPARVLLRKKMDLLKRRVADMERKALKQALSAAFKEEELLKEAVDSAKDDALKRNALSSEFALLRKNAETARDLHRIILKEYNQMGIRARSLVNNVHIVDAPSLPSSPVPPVKQIPFLLILPLVAMLGGCLIAYGVGAMDETIQQPDDLERHFDVRRIGVVPDIPQPRISLASGNGRGQHEFLAYDEPGTPFSNAIRNIQATLFPPGKNGGSKSLLVTSPISSEGKTVISVSLATVLSSGGSKRVLLMDCDFRRPRLHKVFGHSGDEPGLTSLFTAEETDLMKVVRTHRISGLHYLLAGPQPLDPLHLITSARMEGLLCQMKENFDFLICDCSPILAFPDSRFLAPLTDGVMLVTRQGRVKESELRAALNLIASTEGVHFSGVVLNRAQACRGHSYYYYGDDRYCKEYQRNSC